MKKYFAFFILLVIFTTIGFPDIYIKEKYSTGALNSQGETNLGADTVNEFWIGGNKITAITKNRMIILDKTRKQIFFVFPAAKTYVETQLPMDPQSLRSSEVGAILQRIEFNIAVSPTTETRKIKNRNCKKYIVENWIIEGGNRKAEVKRTVWLTGNVPFNLDLYWDVVTHLLKLVSDNEAFFEELQKIKGLPMVSESSRDVQGVPITTRQEVVEISEKKAPAGIYSVPKGYTKQETLSVPDLLTLLKD